MARWPVARFGLAGFGVVVLGGALLWALANEDTCPQGWRSDPGRAGWIGALLRGTAEGRALLANRAGPEDAICFGDAERGAVTHRGLILLPSQAGNADNAARTGHLLLHTREGAPDCAEGLDAALAAEARGHALELRLRVVLGVVEPWVSYPFEAGLREASAETQVRAITDYLRAHPEGTGAIPGFAAIFAERCEGP